MTTVTFMNNNECCLISESLPFEKTHKGASSFILHTSWSGSYNQLGQFMYLAELQWFLQCYLQNGIPEQGNCQSLFLSWNRHRANIFTYLVFCHLQRVHSLWCCYRRVSWVCLSWLISPLIQLLVVQTPYNAFNYRHFHVQYSKWGLHLSALLLIDFFYMLCREFGLQHTVSSVDESDLCAVCLERSCSVAAEGGGYMTHFAWIPFFN